MARYEGMDELLGKVRLHMAVRDATAQEDDTREAATLHNPRYEAALNGVLTILRDAEGLRATVGQGKAAPFTADQLQDLLELVSRAHAELRRCEIDLRRMAMA